MQIKIFTVPIVGSEAVNEELNAFLRGKKVLQVEQQLVQGTRGNYWSFCVRYLESQSTKIDTGKKQRKDYKRELSEAAFARFARFRAVRKDVAKADGIPPFAVFTDEELAGIAQLEELTPVTMKTVKGVGDKKVEKYADHLIRALQDEES